MLKSNWSNISVGLLLAVISISEVSEGQEVYTADGIRAYLQRCSDGTVCLTNSCGDTIHFSIDDMEILNKLGLEGERPSFTTSNPCMSKAVDSQ